MRRGAQIGAALIVLTLSGHAAADESDSDARVRAQQLFESGLADAMAGRYADACPKFAASQAADPKTSTLLNLGRCYESLGRIASAWATLREAEALARKDGRSVLEDTARSSAEALASRLVRITIVVPSAARVPGLVVLRDGKKIEEAEWNVAIPADAGDHEIKAEAPHYKEWRANVKLETSDRSLEIPRLEAAPRPSSSPPVVADRNSWTPLRTTGVVVAGAGIAALATGFVMGLVAKSQYDDARATCPAVDDCSREAVSDSESARSLATAGTITMIAGGALAAAGGVMFLLSPRRQTSARLGFGTIGLVSAW